MRPINDPQTRQFYAANIDRLRNKQTQSIMARDPMLTPCPVVLGIVDSHPSLTTHGIMPVGERAKRQRLLETNPTQVWEAAWWARANLGTPRRGCYESKSNDTHRLWKAFDKPGYGVFLTGLVMAGYRLNRNGTRCDACYCCSGRLLNPQRSKYRYDCDACFAAAPPEQQARLDAKRYDRLTKDFCRDAGI